MCNCGDSTCGYPGGENMCYCDEDNERAGEWACRFYSDDYTHVPVSSDGFLFGQMVAREDVGSASHVINMVNPGDFHLPVAVCATHRAADPDVDDPIRVIAFGGDYEEACTEIREWLREAAKIEGGIVMMNTCDHLAALKFAIQLLVQVDGDLTDDSESCPFTSYHYPICESILGAAKILAENVALRNSNEDNENEDDVALMLGAFIYLHSHKDDTVHSPHWHTELHRSTYSILWSALNITDMRKAHDYLEDASDEVRWVWGRMECQNDAREGES